MARLIPGDSSILFARSLVAVIWVSTPLSILYALLSAFALLPPLLLSPPTRALLEPYLAVVSPSSYLPQRAHHALFFWTTVETIFACYHAHLVRKVQARGPPPHYGRRFLREVFRRSLETGMGGSLESYLGRSGVRSDGQMVHGSDSTAVHTSRSASPGRYALRPRKNHHSSGVPNGLGITSPDLALSTLPSSPSPLRPDAPSARTQTKRKRSRPPLSFIETPLKEDDERAVSFRQRISAWFRGASPDRITRPLMEEWLCWSLYGQYRHEVLAERLEREARGHPNGGNLSDNLLASSLATRVSSLGTESPIPPEKARGDGEGEDGDVEGDDEDEPIEGDKWTFLQYILGLIEARSGRPFPLAVPDPVGGTDDPKAALSTITGAGASASFHPSIRPIRLTLDPVRVISRPLTYYLLVNFVSLITYYRARWKGFRHEKEGDLEYLVRIPEGWTLEKSRRGGKDGELFRPIVILHGLGIGLVQYASLIRCLLRSPLAKTHPMLILLQPHISQSFFHPRFLHPPNKASTTRDLKRALERLGWVEPEGEVRRKRAGRNEKGESETEAGGVSVLSHSNGTIVHAWLLKSIPSMIKRSCFVDPVCFRLFDPDVCYNFLYKRVQTPVEVIMRYFVARELGTANLLSRYFDWSSNLLWPIPEIPRLRSPYHTRFFFAGQDAILNAKMVREYLLEHGVEEVEHGGGLRMDWEKAHGETLLSGNEGMDSIISWLNAPEEQD